jgi:hypothetical protein
MPELSIDRVKAVPLSERMVSPLGAEVAEPFTEVVKIPLLSAVMS